jgi:hypothetical protein
MVGITGISKRIALIFDNFYKQRSVDRFQNLHYIYDGIASAVRSKDAELTVYLDFDKLAELVRSYFIDVIRYKEYHFSLYPEKDGIEPGLDPFSFEWASKVHQKRLNASKQAALTAKWILTYKPISVVSNRSLGSESEVSLYVASINEHYALQAAVIALDLEFAAIPRETVEEIIYNFRFRKFEEGPFYMILSKDYLIGSRSDVSR